MALTKDLKIKEIRVAKPAREITYSTRRSVQALPASMRQTGPEYEALSRLNSNKLRRLIDQPRETIPMHGQARPLYYGGLSPYIHFHSRYDPMRD